MTFPLLSTNSSRVVALIFSFNFMLFFLLKQLWGAMAKQESATVHVTQQVVARLSKSRWVCSCHQPCLAGLGEIERLKLFLCLHLPECLVVLDQGFLPGYFLTEFSEIIKRSIKCILYLYWSHVCRDRYHFIAQRYFRTALYCTVLHCQSCP